LQGREQLDALGGEKLGGVGARELGREADLVDKDAAPRSAYAKAQDAADYADFDEVAEEPPQPVEVPSGDAARLIASALAPHPSAVGQEDDYDMEEPPKQHVPVVPAAANEEAEAPRAEPVAIHLPAWALEAQGASGRAVQPEFRFEALAERRRVVRSQRAAEVCDEAACELRREAESASEDEDDGAPLAAPALPRAARAPQPVPAAPSCDSKTVAWSCDSAQNADAADEAPAAPAARFTAGEPLCRNAAPMGLPSGHAHPSGLEMAHQADWESHIQWGEEAVPAAQRWCAEEDSDDDVTMQVVPCAMEGVSGDAHADGAAHQSGVNPALPALLAAPQPQPPGALSPPRAAPAVGTHWGEVIAASSAPMAAAVGAGRRHTHAQMLRLQSGAPADVRALAWRNRSLACGEWEARVSWEGGGGGVGGCGAGAPLPLLLDLNDPAMTFALRPVTARTSDAAAGLATRAAAKSVALAAATVLPPALAAYAPPRRRAGGLAMGAAVADAAATLDPRALLARLNVSLDDTYAARGNDAFSAHRNALQRPPPLYVAHALPALKLETAASFMSELDARSFHAPRAAWAPRTVPATAPGGIVRGVRRPAAAAEDELMLFVMTLREDAGAELRLTLSSSESGRALSRLVSQRWPEHTEGSFWLVPSKTLREDPFPQPLDLDASLHEQGIVTCRVLYLVARKLTVMPTRLANYVPGPDRPRAPPAAFQSLEDLTARDGHLFIVEYSEQHPVLLSNRAMGARRVCWYRKLAADDTPPQHIVAAAHGADMQTVEAEGASPFLADIAPGARLMALETRMSRSPIWEHPPQASDFVVVRTATGKLLLRSASRTAVVGYIEPHIPGRVPAPKIAEVSAFQERRLQLGVYRKLRALRAAGKEECISMSALREEYPYGWDNNSVLGRVLRAILKPERPGADRWFKLPGLDIPSEEALRQLVSPEAVCGYESMQAARERLQDAGIKGSALINPKTSMHTAVNALKRAPTLRSDSALIALELSLMPWAQTACFLDAMLGRATLRMDTSRQGAARRGHYIHFARKTVRNPEQDEKRAVALALQPKKITGTDNDLRKLSMGDCAAELRKLGLTDEEIGQLTRWQRVGLIRQLSAAAIADGGRLKKSQQRWMRVEREGAAYLQKTQKEGATLLLGRMERMFGSASAPDGDEEGGQGDADTDSDDEDLAKEFELAMLEEAGRGAAKAAALRAAAEERAQDEADEERREQLALRQLLAGEDAATTGSQQQAQPAGTAGKRLQLRRTMHVMHPGGRAETLEEVISDQSVIDAYVTARDAGGDIVAAVLAAQGADGVLPYPLRGTTAKQHGRYNRPELKARRDKEAEKKQARKEREAAAQYEKLKSAGLCATTLQGGVAGPGGLMVGAGDGGVKLKMNLSVGLKLAARLKPEAKKSAARMGVFGDKPPPKRKRRTPAEMLADAGGEDEEGMPRWKRVKTERRDPGASGLGRGHYKSRAVNIREARAEGRTEDLERYALNRVLKSALDAVTRKGKFDVFEKRINATDPEKDAYYEDYLEYIRNPRDLRFIKGMKTRTNAARLDRCYTSVDEFVGDAAKIAANTRAYNAPEGRAPGRYADPSLPRLADKFLEALRRELEARAPALEAAQRGEEDAAEEEEEQEQEEQEEEQEQEAQAEEPLDADE